MRNYSNTNFIKSQAKLKQISKELKKLIKYAKIEKDMAFFLPSILYRNIYYAISVKRGCAFIIINVEGYDMMKKENESKEIADRDQQGQITEEYEERILRDSNELVDYEPADNYYSPFEFFFNIIGKIAILVVFVSMVLFCGSLIKERISLKNQIADMQTIIDKQEKLLSEDYKVVDFDSIDKSDSDEFTKILMGELKTTQVYFENRIYSLSIQQVSEENIIKFYQDQIEKVEDADTKVLFQDLLDNHKQMNEELLSDISEANSMLEEFHKVMESIESGEIIPEEDLEKIFQNEETLGVL